MCVEFPSLMFPSELLRIDQVSSTLDLVHDYFRFVIGFFEVINISAPHIYRSALPLSPLESIVREVHKSYIQQLPRVVCGLPISWEPAVATVRHSDLVERVAWSSCSRFIAVALPETIEIRDAATLERLHTFTHPRTGRIPWLSFSPDSLSLTQFINHAGHTTWDLQTGGRINVIFSTPSLSSSRGFSSTYSADGRIVGVAYRDWGSTFTCNVTIISTYNLLLGTYIHSHRVSEGQFIAPIWTHGEFIRFASMKRGSITIWEVGFTSEHTLAEIRSLPAPDDIGSEESLFLPTRTRLAFILQKRVLVWDAQDSKILLNFAGDNQPTGLSFSSNGHLFACGITGGGIHLWKESPTGYVPHRKLASDIGGSPSAELLLSPNGESIITSKHSETRLWRTTDPITSLPIIPTQPNNPSDFILEFSPDRSLAAAARLGYNTVRIIDLKSGNPRLIIDAGMGICGLGVTAKTVIVVGLKKVITWYLPAGGCVLNATANIHDRLGTIMFKSPPVSHTHFQFAAISPNLDYLVITWGPYEKLGLYDISTGENLCTTSRGGYRPWFTRDGREVWSSTNGISMEGWKICKGVQPDIIRLKPLGPNANPSGRYPWESSHAHDVMDDGWILDSRKKRVMWLPHRWRIPRYDRIWNGPFLGLLNDKLPEPVILELYRASFP